MTNIDWDKPLICKNNKSEAKLFFVLPKETKKGVRAFVYAVLHSNFDMIEQVSLFSEEGYTRDRCYQIVNKEEPPKVKFYDLEIGEMFYFKEDDECCLKINIGPQWKQAAYFNLIKGKLRILQDESVDVIREKFISYREKQFRDYYGECL